MLKETKTKDEVGGSPAAPCPRPTKGRCLPVTAGVRGYATTRTLIAMADKGLPEGRCLDRLKAWNLVQRQSPTCISGPF